MRQRLRSIKFDEIFCHPGAPVTCGCIEIVLIVLFLIAALLMLILIPLSFGYVEWDEIAFKKNQYTNNVQKDQVYTNGRYNWGIAHNTPLTFPAQYVNVEYNGNDKLLVFSTNGLEFAIECALQYRLSRNSTELGNMYDEYNTNYHNQVLNVAKATIKRIAPTYSILDYATRREEITRDMNRALTIDIRKLWINVPNYKFQLLRIIFPGDIKKKFLDNAIQIQLNEVAQFQQQANVIRKETETLVSEIEANITRINSDASSKAEQIVRNANALSFTIKRTAESRGLEEFFEALNVTLTTTKEKFLKLFAILDNPKNKLIFGDLPVLLNI